MKRLAILSTHPIQYNAPLFRMLHEDDSIELHVFFSKTWDQVKFDPDFQREVVWDIPITEGYLHSTHDASKKAGKQDLERTISNFGPDALLVYGWNFPGHMAMMRKFHGSVPIWFRGDSHLLNPLPFWKKTLRRLTLHWVYQHVDIAFPVGKANAEYYLWSGLSKNQLISAPHAVDNNFWERNEHERSEKARTWRKELGIPQDAAIIGFAGKLEPLKQVGHLIQAAMSTAEAHLVIAGSGPLEKPLKEQAREFDRTHFVGFVNQSDMPTFYRMVDILALVSYSETWGLCINEALASGARCFLSDRVGCHLDVLSVAERGTTVGWDRPEEWAAALEKLLNAPPRTGADREAFSSAFNLRGFHEAIKKAFA